MKIIVIGLDGGCFEIIQGWLNDDLLPNLKKMMETGVYGDLRSCLPPVTFPNWKCYSTGKNPGKLGVYGWETVDLKNRIIRIPRSQDFKGRDFWEYSNFNGFKTGIMNMPGTYPPKPVKGFMVTGGPDSGAVGYTFPPALEKYLRAKYNYSVHRKGSKNLDDPQAVEEILNLIDLRFRVAKNLLRKEAPDFFHLTIFYINVLQHFFWRGDPTFRGWKKIDKHIKDLTQGFDNVIIMSDHGCNEIKRTFYVNNWLKKEGYLHVRKRPIDVFFNTLANHRMKDALFSFIRRFPHFSRFVKKHVPGAFIPTVSDETGAVRKQDKMQLINWEKTKALASGQGPIYLNIDKEHKDYLKLLDELKNKFESIVDPFTGEKVILKAYEARELYGECLGRPPELVLDQNLNYHIDGSLGGDQISGQSRNWKGENKKEGLFIACGKDIKKGEVKNVRIIDLAPTILHMFGIPIPEDIDGRVLKEIFRKPMSIS